MAARVRPQSQLRMSVRTRRWRGRTGWCLLAPSGPIHSKLWNPDSLQTHMGLWPELEHTVTSMWRRGTTDSPSLWEACRTPQFKQRLWAQRLFKADFFSNILYLLCFRLRRPQHWVKTDWWLAFTIWVTYYNYTPTVCDVLHWSPSIMWLEQSLLTTRNVTFQASIPGWRHFSRSLVAPLDYF